MTEEPASPPCYAAGADDAYMGYAGRAELLAALNGLLAAARAGTKVAVKSRRASTASGYSALVRRLRDDEARWCRMLATEIRRLGGTPTPETAALMAEAMAIDDPGRRLACLARGQQQLAGTLEALRPRVRDDMLHGMLGEMLGDQRESAARIEHFRRQPGSRTIPD